MEKEVNYCSEQGIQDALFSYYSGSNYIYKSLNVFIYGWESDFWMMTKAGYAWEIEIKISRADFKLDAKKEKHRTMDYISRETAFVPNKFMYACPDGVIAPEEVPAYAGLIWVDSTGNVVIKKDAGYFHKCKYDYTKKLVDKFYYNYINYRGQLRWLKYDNKNKLIYLENRNRILTEQVASMSKVIAENNLDIIDDSP